MLLTVINETLKEIVDLHLCSWIHWDLYLLKNSFFSLQDKKQYFLYAFSMRNLLYAASLE